MGLFGSKELIGLDIGSSSVKMAHVKAVGAENRLRKFGVFPLPADAIVDGAIMDHGAVVEGIKTALRELKIHEKEVAISLSGHSVIIKKVQLPTTTAEELEESIQWEVEQYIPFDIKDVKIDFQVIGPLKDDPSKMDVLLVAAKTDLINDYMSVVKDAGLVPRIVDIDSLAAGNAFELTHPVSDEQVPMVVNVGASFMNINILHAGVPLFTRDVPMGGGMYTTEIQKQVAVSFETAEEYKTGKEGTRGARREGHRDHEGRIEPSRHRGATILQLLLRDLPRPPGDESVPDRRCLQVSVPEGDAGGKNRGRRGDLRSVRGVDGGRKSRRLVRGFPTQHLRNGVGRSRAAEPGGSRMIRINLVRGKRKKRRELDGGATWIALPLVVLAATIYFHTTVSGRISKLDAEIGKANSEIVRLKKEIGEVEKFKARKAELQKKVDIISNLQKGRTGPVRYFEALSASIPEKCWIDTLGVKDEQVTLSGVALNNYTIANFMTALGQTGRFRNVVLGAAEQTIGGGCETREVQLDVPDGQLNALSPGEDTEWR